MMNEVKKAVVQAFRAMGHEVIDFGNWQEVMYDKMSITLANPVDDITGAVEEMITEGSITIRGHRDVVRFGKLGVRIEDFPSANRRLEDVVRVRVLDLDEYRAQDLYGDDSHATTTLPGHFVH